MECMSPLQKKRRHGGDLGNWSDFQPKRACGGVSGCAQVEFGAVVEEVDYPMDTWDTESPLQGAPSGNGPHPDPRTVYVQAGSPTNCCPRCMAGEPGHINHIMGC